MSHHHIRVPPDSSGKRVLQRALMEIVYGSGTVAFMPGDIVVAASSAITGTVTEIEGTLSSGTLTIQLDENSPTVPTTGEALLVGATPCAVVAAATPYYVQTTTVVSSDNARNGQVINEYGASLIAFTEGQPTLTSDGALRTGHASTLGRYSFVDDSNEYNFWHDTAGSGACTYAATSSTRLLQVGSDNGARAQMTTLRYHPYIPGTGNTSLYSLILGDVGKVGNVREWGNGDNRNGLFWTLNGTTLGVTVRSDATGSVVDTFVPRSDWNGDLLDGTGPSRFTLDVATRNVYWIDFLWLGSGAVRFGVLDALGRRLTAHTMQHVGVGVLPYMSTATLPLHVANRNVAPTASTTEMRLVCMSISANHEHAYSYDRYAEVQGTTLKPISSETPVLSIRPKTMYAGKINRIQITPDTVSLLVTGGPVRVDFVFGVSSLTGDAWVVGDSSIDYDVTATAVGPYLRKAISLILDAGAHNIDMARFIEPNNTSIGLHPDGVTLPVMSCLLTKLVPSDTVTALAALTHREHRV